ncbi:MAG: hypothetical protein HY307_04980 [Arcobacter sp.]|nr:hypothetical protein [Arcobacter sp.]
MTNTTGTILRAFGTISVLIFFWYLVVAGLYFVIGLAFEFGFDIKISFVIFTIFLLMRMLYPKNVFI